MVPLPPRRLSTVDAEHQRSARGARQQEPGELRTRCCGGDHV